MEPPLQDLGVFVTAILDLSELELDEATSLVNRANSLRREPFTGDRLGTTTLKEQYPGAVMVRLRQEGSLVGSVTLQPEPASLWVYLLAVDPLCRGRGIGALLLDLAARMAAERNLTRLELEAVDEGRLIAYYEGLGFHETGRMTKPAGHWRASRPYELVTLQRPVQLLETFPST